MLHISARRHSAGENYTGNGSAPIRRRLPLCPDISLTLPLAVCLLISFISSHRSPIRGQIDVMTTVVATNVCFLSPPPTFSA